MPHTPSPELSTGRAVSLYVGALLGPSLLLLPGLAAALAGPASILAWTGLLAVSGLLARVFTAFGTRVRSGGGVIAYTAAGLGERAGRAVGWCFLTGVMLGAPVVCLIGGTYVAAALGAGHTTAVLAAAGLLLAVVALTLGGARFGTAVQLGLVALLVALVAVAMAGAAPAARTANWTPFAPHGWAALGTAASALMLSFVGWEAVAPLTSRLRSPGRQLPRVIAAAFAVTAAVYLGLAATTIAVLGTRAGTAVPLAALLDIALGPAGRIIAAAAAVALTLAATNAYLTGAAEMLTSLRRPPARTGRGRAPLPQIGAAVAGLLLFAGDAAGVVGTARLVMLPTTLFLVVYLGCTVSGVRALRGPVRAAAGVSAFAVAVVLAFCGWALLPAAVIAAIAGAGRRGRISPAAAARTGPDRGRGASRG